MNKDSKNIFLRAAKDKLFRLRHHKKILTSRYETEVAIRSNASISLNSAKRLNDPVTIQTRENELKVVTEEADSTKREMQTLTDRIKETEREISTLENE